MTPPSTNAEYLDETVRHLWPGGSLVAASRRSTAAAFSVLPSIRDPRWLMPRDASVGLAAVLDRNNHETARSRRWIRTVGAASLRRGLFTRIGSAVAIEGGGTENIESFLTELLGRDVRVVVGIGVPRANQKPVLQALEATGRTIAYIKVGTDDATSRLVRQEAASLAHPALRNVPGLIAPTVTALAQWRGLDLLVLEPLHASGRVRPRRDIPAEQMRALSEINKHSASVATSGWFTRIADTTSALPDAAARERFAALVDFVGSAVGDVTLVHGAWHGDWGPWNMSWRDDSVMLWDWERFDDDVPVGFDAVHYAIRSMTRRHGSSPSVAKYALRSAPGLLKRLNVHGTHADTTIGLYLLEITRRYLAASHESRGTSLRSTAAWTLSMTEAYWARPGAG